MEEGIDDQIGGLRNEMQAVDILKIVLADVLQVPQQAGAGPNGCGVTHQAQTGQIRYGKMAFDSTSRFRSGGVLRDRSR
jgi:hypothetical protein